VNFFAKRDLNQVYSIIPKFQKWWIINCVINVIWVVLQGSTLAKEKTCETTTSNFAKHGHACMAMQKKSMDDKLHIQKNSFIIQV